MYVVSNFNCTHIREIACRFSHFELQQIFVINVPVILFVGLFVSLLSTESRPAGTVLKIVEFMTAMQSIHNSETYFIPRLRKSSMWYGGSRSIALSDKMRLSSLHRVSQLLLLLIPTNVKDKYSLFANQDKNTHCQRSYFKFLYFKTSFVILQ